MKNPSNLEECFYVLLKNSSYANIELFMKIKEEDGFIPGTHFLWGMSLRNNWGLWRKNKLTNFFNKLGIYHADDMSTIIITSFHRYLHNININLEKQVKFFIDFWKKEGYKNGNPLIE